MPCLDLTFVPPPPLFLPVCVFVCSDGLNVCVLTYDVCVGDRTVLCGYNPLQVEEDTAVARYNALSKARTEERYFGA